MKLKAKLFLLSTFSLAAACAAGSAAAQSCESLAGVALPHVTITAAQLVTGGSFTPPGSTTAQTGLPPFCRIAVTSTPAIR